MRTEFVASLLSGTSPGGSAGEFVRFRRLGLLQATSRLVSQRKLHLSPDVLEAACLAVPVENAGADDSQSVYVRLLQTGWVQTELSAVAHVEESALCHSPLTVPDTLEESLSEYDGALDTLRLFAAVLHDAYHAYMQSMDGILDMESRILRAAPNGTDRCFLDIQLSSYRRALSAGELFWLPCMRTANGPARDALSRRAAELEEELSHAEDRGD